MRSKAKLYSRQVSRLSIIGLLLVLGSSLEGAVRVWDGGGTDNRWLTAANWVGDVAPVSGDTLVFPEEAQAARVDLFNNFPAYTEFDSLLISNSYNFSGNPFAIRSGITLFGTDLPYQPAFSMSMALTAPQTFRVSIGKAGPGLQFLGEIDTGGHEITLDPFGANDVIDLRGGAITGTGGIKKIGRGSLWLYALETTYSRVTHIVEGTVRVNYGNGDFSSAGRTIVEAGAELLLLDVAYTVNEPLTLSGKLIGGPGIIWAAPIHLPGNVAEIGATNGPFRIWGEISGPGGLVIPQVGGAPVLLQAATNTYLGPTRIRGHAVIDAVQPQSDVLLAGGYLSGGGSVGNVTAIGPLLKTLAPGIDWADSLTTRGLALDSLTTVEFNLDRTTTLFNDSIHVVGGVDLGNARLQTTWGTSTPDPNQQYTLIHNDGNDAVIGTFANLPEGALVTSNTVSGAPSTIFLRITYRGGTDSNDVVLYPGARPNPYWDGGGADDLWTTAANWIGDVAPQPGQALVFPYSQSSSTNITINDFPAGTTFQSLSIYDRMELQGALLALDGGIRAYRDVVITLPLRLNAPQTIFVDDDASLRVSGGIDNGGHDLMLDADGTATLDVQSNISGGGGLISDGPWRSYTHLRRANTYSGRTEVRDGNVVVYDSHALGSTETRTIVLPMGKLWLADGVVIAEPLILGGTLTGSGVCNGPIDVMDYYYGAGIGTLSNEVMLINGAISGSFLFVSGAGTTILTGTNTHAGTLLSGGTVFVNGYQPSSTISFYNGASTLGGFGTVGRIIGGYYAGTIAPGTNSVGTLTLGEVSLSANQQLSIEINDATPGSYDQLVVNGSVILDSPTLAVTLGYVPAPGDSFVIISNDGADPVQGTFFLLPEGAATNVAGHDLRISYVGGDGNDVVLTAGPALVTIGLWDGGGTNAFWTTAANWAGDVAPQPGDFLVLSADAARKTNINNFPAGTTFRSLTVLGRGYDTYEIHGQALRLEAGIVSMSSLNRIVLPLQIQADQTFSGGLRIDGSVDLGANTLTLARGDFTINGVISGTGGIAMRRGYNVVRLFATNTYSGITTLADTSILTINNARSLGTTDQPTIVGRSSTLQTSGIGPFLEPLIVAGNLYTTSWTGPIETISSNAMFSGTIEGTISGTGGVYALGLRLLGNNTYTGPTINDYGLTVEGDQPQSDCVNLSPSMFLSGVLGGSGRVGNVTAMRGTVSPGSYASFVSRLSTKNLDLRKASTLLIESTETEMGTTYDQVRVSGSVKLEEPTLLFLPYLYLPKPGQSFTIIDNDGTDPIQGTFEGWPQGGFKVLTNMMHPAFEPQSGIFQIDYTGGDGNDVVISCVEAPPATILSLNSSADGIKWLTGRGVPGAAYTLEATSDLNPVVHWMQLDADYAEPNGIFSLYDYPPPTNSMRFYRVRSF